MPETPAPEAEAPQMGLPEMKQMLHDYQVPMSEGTLSSIVGEGGVDQAKANAFQEYVKTAAQGLYPTFAPQIKAGIPTAFLLDPYRQVGKQILGEGFEPDFVGNTLHAKAHNGGVDPATGRPAPMSLDAWAKYLKTESSFGWQNTPDGINARRAVLKAIKNEFSRENM
jgi:hypothetical protein